MTALVATKLSLLLAFQIILCHVWARFTSYPEIPTPRYSVVGFTPISLGLTCMLRVCLHRELWRGRRERLGKSVLGSGGSRSTGKEPPASRRLPITFWLMDNHIGESLIELWWPQPIKG